MVRLIIFYKRLVKALVIAIATLSFSLVNLCQSYIARHIAHTELLNHLIRIAASSLFFSLFFFLGEWLLRKHLWRMSFFNMDINFNGKWNGWTLYTSLEVESPTYKKKGFLPFHTVYEATIRQDCLKAQFTSSVGKDFLRWSSISVNISETNDLQFTYFAHYEGDRKRELGDKSIGFCELTVVQKHPQNNKLPILLTGNFYHCATGSGPKYRGSVIYVRQRYKHLVDERFLPGFARNYAADVLR